MKEAGGKGQKQDHFHNSTSFETDLQAMLQKARKPSCLSLQSQVFELHFEIPLNVQNSPSKLHMWWHHKCKILSSTYSSCQDGTSPEENF